MKVLLAIHHRFELWNAPDWLGPRLKRDFPEHEFVQLKDLHGLIDEIVDAEVLIGWQLRPEQFKAARRLCWIHATTAAVHQLMFPELVASNVQVTNSSAIHGPVVAEHAIALVFALAKGLPFACMYQAQSHWGQQDLWRSDLRPREVQGATLGVIGLGAIGRECVGLAKALGMRVLASREHPDKGSEGAERVFGPAQLEQLLAEAEYVLLAAPLTSRTRAVFNDEAFSKMDGKNQRQMMSFYKKLGLQIIIAAPNEKRVAVLEHIDSVVEVDRIGESARATVVQLKERARAELRAMDPDLLSDDQLKKLAAE